MWHPAMPQLQTLEMGETRTGAVRIASSQSSTACGDFSPALAVVSSRPASVASASLQSSERQPSDPGAAKLEPSARKESAETAVSLFAMRDVWLAPFMAELVLMLGAMWLSYCLLQVTVASGVPFSFPVASVLLPGGVYALLAAYSREHELFLPRKVVLLGVGPMLLLALGFAGVFCAEAFFLGSLKRLINASLAIAPILFFIVRCCLIFAEARFTPSIESLAWRRRHRGKPLDRLRRKLRFWLS